MFYAIINYQFQTSELKNEEKLFGEANKKHKKVLLEKTGNVEVGGP